VEEERKSEVMRGRGWGERWRRGGRRGWGERRKRGVRRGEGVGGEEEDRRRGGVEEEGEGKRNKSGGRGVKAEGGLNNMIT